MKRLILLLAIMLVLTGCASSRVATSIGEDIGYSFTKAAAKGEVSAEQSIKAWPYVSGLVRGLLAEDFDYKVPLSAQNIMDNLDAIAQQGVLSPEDKGMVIGSYVRLEYIAATELWNKYGISIWRAVKTFLAR
jgi:hypothetical protein